MGKIKRPSAVDGFASDVFRAPRYYIFKRSLPSPRRESLSTPNGSFSLRFVLFLSLSIFQPRKIDVQRGLRERVKRNDSRAPTKRLRPKYSGNSLYVIFVGGSIRWPAY